MPLVRLAIREVDVQPFDRALTYALDTWTSALRAGSPHAWEQFAVEVHSARHTLRRTSSLEECRRLVLIGSVAEALTAVANECERGNPQVAALASMVRHYADAAASSEGKY